jgi:uncharacterized protein YqjF (DUF2071 family)
MLKNMNIKLAMQITTLDTYHKEAYYSLVPNSILSLKKPRHHVVDPYSKTWHSAVPCEIAAN